MVAGHMEGMHTDPDIKIFRLRTERKGPPIESGRAKKFLARAKYSAGICKNTLQASLYFYTIEPETF